MNNEFLDCDATLKFFLILLFYKLSVKVSQKLVIWPMVSCFMTERSNQKWPFMWCCYVETDQIVLVLGRVMLTSFLICSIEKQINSMSNCIDIQIFRQL